MLQGQGAKVWIGLCLCVLLTACGGGRELARGERAFAADIFGPGLDLDAVRIAVASQGEAVPEPAPLPQTKVARKPRPGVCDRTNPTPREGPPPGFTLYNTINISPEFYREDLLPGWPEDILLPHALLMGHELVHVWQWQNRAQTGYRPGRAALESFTNRDPYFYVPKDGAGFLEYGYEQQASLVEDYLCYGIFDPANPRRAKLRGILAPYFQVDRIDAVLGQ